VALPLASIEANPPEQKKQIIDLYLQCLTYEQISEKVGASIGKISEIFKKFKTELSEKPIVPESLQLFNVWNFQSRVKISSQISVICVFAIFTTCKWLVSLLAIANIPQRGMNVISETEELSPKEAQTKPFAKGVVGVRPPILRILLHTRFSL
jgi:hypothetical protein